MKKRLNSLRRWLRRLRKWFWLFSKIVEKEEKCQQGGWWNLSDGSSQNNQDYTASFMFANLATLIGLSQRLRGYGWFWRHSKRPRCTKSAGLGVRYFNCFVWYALWSYGRDSVPIYCRISCCQSGWNRWRNGWEINETDEFGRRMMFHMLRRCEQRLCIWSRNRITCTN